MPFSTFYSCLVHLLRAAGTRFLSRQALAAWVAFLSLAATDGQAQITRTIERSNGSLCVGREVAFFFNGDSGDNVSNWEVNGGTIVSQTTTLGGSVVSIVARWNSPTTTAYVTAEYISQGSSIRYPVSLGTFEVLPTYVPSLILSTAATSVCANSAVTFTASLNYGGNSPIYEWTVDGIRLDDERAASLTTYFTTAGAHTVAVTANLSGTSYCVSTHTVRASRAVTVKPLLNPSVVAQGPTAFASGGSVTLRTSASPQYTYQWQQEHVNIVGATSDRYVATQAGYYSVLVTQNGCTAASAPFWVTAHTYTQAISENAVNTRTLYTPVTTNSQIAALPVESVRQSITYLDGLGRAAQTVAVQQSPGKKDLVNVSVTDFVGREAQQYLPYASGNDGSYQKDALIRQRPSTKP